MGLGRFHITVEQSLFKSHVPSATFNVTNMQNRHVTRLQYIGRTAPFPLAFFDFPQSWEALDSNNQYSRLEHSFCMLHISCKAQEM